jgi:Uma2 family endonuclease
MAVRERLITVREFEAFIAQAENKNRLFELRYGEIAEKMPTRLHGILAGNFVTEFNIYLRQHPVGLAAVEARHRPEGDERNVRMPDVSLVLGDKPVEARGTADYMPDIVVEVQSPDDSWREIFEHAMFYLDHGTQIVVLVFPHSRQVEKLTQTERAVLNENDTLDLTELLPDFTLPISAIFRGL